MQLSQATRREMEARVREMEAARDGCARARRHHAWQEINKKDGSTRKDRDESLRGAFEKELHGKQMNQKDGSKDAPARKNA